MVGLFCCSILRKTVFGRCGWSTFSTSLEPGCYSWKIVPLRNVSRINSNRLRLKRLMPVDHDQWRWFAPVFPASSVIMISTLLHVLVRCYSWLFHTLFVWLSPGSQWESSSVFPVSLVPCHRSRTSALCSSWMVQALRVQRVRFASRLWHPWHLAGFCRSGLWQLTCVMPVDFGNTIRMLSFS